MFANIFFEEANKYHVFVGLRFHKIKIGWMGCCGWVKKGKVLWMGLTCRSKIGQNLCDNHCLTRKKILFTCKFHPKHTIFLPSHNTPSILF